MKKFFFLILIIIAAAGVWWWQNPDQAKSYAAKASHETGMFLLNLFEKEKVPDPALPHEPPPPPPPPENIYYTREQIVSGVYPDTKTLGIATKVRKVGEGNGKFLVESENNRLLVEPSKLTRDPAEIGRLIRLAAAPKPVDQSAVHALRSEIEALDRKIAETNTELKAKEALESKAKPGGPGATMSTTNSRFLKNEIIRLEAQKAQLRKRLDALTAVPNPPSQNPGSPPSKPPNAP